MRHHTLPAFLNLNDRTTGEKMVLDYSDFLMPNFDLVMSETLVEPIFEVFWGLFVYKKNGMKFHEDVQIRLRGISQA